MTPIEIIALIVIVVSVIKMLVLLVNPTSWMNMAKGFYKSPGVFSFIGLILAAIVLYYLVAGGMTIIQILAAAAFVSLLLMIGIAPHADSLIKKYQAQAKRGRVFQDNWLYALIWIVLLIWGIKELWM